MTIYVVDVESDGSIPFKYSMVCFGAVKLDRELKTTFYGKTKPISNTYNPEALAISGFTREEHLNFDDPKKVMTEFRDWIMNTSDGRPIFISDNNGYDFAWIHWYFEYFLGVDPFGFSSRRIGDIYSGLMKDMSKGSHWKKFKKTPHDHNPVNDSLGNAEALLYMVDNLGLKLKF